MQSLISGFDHVAVLVRDIERARQCYERLGFSLTARGHHERYGTHNHTFVFQHDYCELLGVARPTEANGLLQNVLTRFEGLWLVAFACQDAHAVHAHFATTRIRTTDAQDYSREVDVETERGVARFTSVQVSPEDVPGMFPIFCQHHTPELVWQPWSRQQPNGVLGIQSLDLIVPDLDAALEPYRNFFARELTPYEDGARVMIGAQSIQFRAPASFSAQLRSLGVEPLEHRPPYLGAMTLRVNDLAATGQLLTERNVSHVRSDTAVIVDPREACGAVLIFTELPDAQGG